MVLSQDRLAQTDRLARTVFTTVNLVEVLSVQLFDSEKLRRAPASQATVL
jgi:hypothetical protein